jgi:hypothetical protein
VDSWFTCDALIQAIRSVKHQKVHLIGMYKFAKTKFEVLEMDADDVLEKMLTNSKAETMFMALCASMVKEE